MMLSFYKYMVLFKIKKICIERSTKAANSTPADFSPSVPIVYQCFTPPAQSNPAQPAMNNVAVTLPSRYRSELFSLLLECANFYPSAVNTANTPPDNGGPRYFNCATTDCLVSGTNRNFNNLQNRARQNCNSLRNYNCTNRARCVYRARTIAPVSGSKLKGLYGTETNPNGGIAPAGSR